MRNWDAFSFKKIVAPDFFESTLPGAWLTISGGIIMLILFLAELRGFLTVSLVSEVCVCTRADAAPTALSARPCSLWLGKLRTVGAPRVFLSQTLLFFRSLRARWWRA